MAIVTETTDLPDSFSTPLTLATGDRFDGTLSGNFDVDEFDVIRIEADVSVSYMLQNVTEGFRWIGLYDAAGTYVGEVGSTGLGANKTWSFNTAQSGTHYLRFEAAIGSSNWDYGFDFGSEIRNSQTSAARLTLETPYQGIWDYAYDSDWLGIDLLAGQTYVFALGTTADRPVLELFDAAGNELSTVQSSVSGDTFIWYTPSQDGTYFVGAYDGFGAATSYSMTVRSEQGNSSQSGVEMAVDYQKATIARFDGTHDYVQDVDWTAIELRGGYTYDFAFSDAVTNTYIRLVNADGQPLRSAGDSSNNGPTAGFSYRASEDGTYYFVTDLGVNRARPDEIEGDASYTIRVTNPLIEVLDTNGGRVLGLGGNDSIRGNLGDDFISGGKGNDTAIGFNGDDTMFGYGGDDLLWGFNDNDLINGGWGHDSLNGQNGADTVIGGGGNDEIFGGLDADIVEGGAGRDRLWGGTGPAYGDGAADRFVFTALYESRTGWQNRDVIEDFERGLDRIDLRQIDADKTQTGNQAFDWIGRRAFSDTAGELRFEVITRSEDSRDVVVLADADGDGQADFELLLKGESWIWSSDFLL